MGSICAVVIPIYRKPKPSELLSLKIVQTVLSRHSIFIVLPSSLDFHSSHAKLIRLPDDRLASIKNYACLMVDKSFYNLFADFEYILIYQLDCLVFADRLVEFCSLGLDYIAPLILGRSDGFWPSNDIVGVGGFSLRKVSSFLRILELIEQPQYKNEAMSLAGRIHRNGAEDMFWSLAAPPWIKISLWLAQKLRWPLVTRAILSLAISDPTDDSHSAVITGIISPFFSGTCNGFCRPPLKTCGFSLTFLLNSHLQKVSMAYLGYDAC